MLHAGGGLFSPFFVFLFPLFFLLFLPFLIICIEELEGKMDVFSDLFFCRKNTGILPFIC